MKHPLFSLEKLLPVVLFVATTAGAGQQTITSIPLLYGQNLVLYSEDFSQYVWANYYDGPANRTANTTDVADPLGNYHATKLMFGNFTGIRYPGIVQSGSSRIAGQPYTLSIWLRGSAGGETVRIGSDDYSISSLITLTNQWQLYTFYDSSVGASRGRLFELFTTTQIATIYAYGAQLSLGPAVGYQKTGASLKYQPLIQVVTSAGLLQVPLDSTLALDTASVSMAIKAKAATTDVFTPPTTISTGSGTNSTPNFTVTLSKDVASGSVLRIYMNGLLLASVSDYTVAGRVITFLRAFDIGDVIQAVYTSA